MPRTARLLLENACYHVITRGNRKQRTFLEDSDFETYLGLLSGYRRRFPFKLYSYCLMPNHVHLLLDPQEPPVLARVLRGINLRYAQYFNEKYKKVGHLWQDRFKSFVVDRDTYLLKLMTYIEMNPVRAEIAQDPLAYPWSSYKARVTGKGGEFLDEVVY